MKLIIFSYPCHFRISQYCKHYALQNLPDVTEVIYAWDDIYWGDHQSLIDELEKTNKVIRYSEFKNVSKTKDGWLRQQFVKLQLHHYFRDDHYLILDGDTLIRNKYQVDLKKPTFFVDDAHYTPYFYFIKKCLGLKKRNNFSFISPFNFFEREVLESLENFSIQRNGCDVVKFYQKNKWKKYKSTPPFSECEIYGTFATQILKKEYNTTELDYIMMSDIKSDVNNTTKNLVLHGSDSVITEEEWNCISNNLNLTSHTAQKK